MSFQATKRLEWVAKLASRFGTEQVGDLPAIDVNTVLILQRLNLNVYGPMDFGVEYRTLAQSDADDRRQGWLGEVSWRLQRHIRLGVGYNFTDFSDNEFSRNDYSVQGWYLRIQGIY